MYTQKDVDSVNAQMKRRVFFWLIPEVILLCALVYSFIKRVEWLSALLLSLLAILLFASLTLSILPVKRYRDFIKNAVHGRNRVETVRFDAFEEETVQREGVRFYPVLMRADTKKEELEERQFYWDANKSRPEWTQGSQYTLTSHEKMIIAWEDA